MTYTKHTQTQQHTQRNTHIQAHQKLRSEATKVTQQQQQQQDPKPQHNNRVEKIHRNSSPQWHVVGLDFKKKNIKKRKII